MRFQRDDAKIVMDAGEGHWICVDSQINSEDTTAMTWQLPGNIGTGQFVTHTMGGGLALTVSHVRLTRALHAKLEEPEKKVHLVFSIKGTSTNTTPYFKDGFQIKQGFNSLYWTPDRKMVRQAAEGETLQTVVVSFPKGRLKGFESGMDVCRKEGAFFQHPNSPLINNVLHQILNCHYSDKVRQLFLESKALELMALKWACIESARMAELSPEQMRGVEKVKTLLLGNIQDPPSIHALSRFAGMSHPILNRCFKQAEGCSVFEFLRRQRLELSRDMVQNSTMSMTEIAHAAGYASSSHFSRAFTCFYGLTPTNYRKIQ